ncbi:MAG: hypothetical protein ABIR34_02795 [Marmoricola sp.]
MSFTLLPHLAAFIIGFGLLATAGLIALLGTATMFFSENHTVRVRRHEGVLSYYGHLALGR